MDSSMWSLQLLKEVLCCEDNWSPGSTGFCVWVCGRKWNWTLKHHQLKICLKTFLIQKLAINKNFDQKHLLSSKILSFTLEYEKCVLKTHSVLSILSHGFLLWHLEVKLKVADGTFGYCPLTFDSIFQRPCYAHTIFYAAHSLKFSHFCFFPHKHIRVYVWPSVK